MVNFVDPLNRHIERGGGMMSRFKFFNVKLENVADGETRTRNPWTTNPVL